MLLAKGKVFRVGLVKGAALIFFHIGLQFILGHPHLLLSLFDTGFHFLSHIGVFKRTVSKRLGEKNGTNDTADHDKVE